MTRTVSVLYFAAARERVGLSSEPLVVEGGAGGRVTVAEVKASVLARHAALRPLVAHLRVAVNQEFSGDEAEVPEGAEVALIPPVAGGADRADGTGGSDDRFRVLDTPLSPERVTALVASTSKGGVVTFIGRVRDVTAGKAVVKLDYEAYRPMAERVLAQIAGEMAREWPGAELAIHHRVGTLKPGELAVVIAAAAPHRKEAFRACETALERLKQDVPIWKKEHFADGAVWVGLGP